ncbi:hypothetical protein ATANTOWER_000927 [Ataeniobius toweri]|uniref:Uncharacterized protein n=1 Tax=Ataeniobius toweri TaxID=208326 RepID=A0ABU7BWN4_9TELE|nr:hypothetical protein [Ataeniobius toweri]
MVHCTLCISPFSTGSGGRFAEVAHPQTKKHKESLTARLSVPSVTTSFKKVEPSQRDCTAPLTRKLPEPKFLCARTRVTFLHHGLMFFNRFCCYTRFILFKYE